jgi:hypothetical protein
MEGRNQPPQSITVWSLKNLPRTHSTTKKETNTLVLPQAISIMKNSSSKNGSFIEIFVFFRGGERDSAPMQVARLLVMNPVGEHGWHSTTGEQLLPADPICPCGKDGK